MRFLIIIVYLKLVSSSPRSAYVCPFHAIDWSRLSPPSSTNEGRRRERATAILVASLLPAPRSVAFVAAVERSEGVCLNAVARYEGGRHCSSRCKRIRERVGRSERRKFDVRRERNN